MCSNPYVTVTEGGTIMWEADGIYHRDDGPAIEIKNGPTIWFINGICHREDGPAFYSPRGRKEYYLFGQKITEEKLKQITYSD